MPAAGGAPFWAGYELGGFFAGYAAGGSTDEV